MMVTKKYLILVGFIISKVFAKECPGKIISNYICIPQNYTNSNDESPWKPPYNYINATLMDVQVVKFDDLLETLTLKMTLEMYFRQPKLAL